MRSILLFLAALILLGAPAASALADMPSFYLSTDKLFTTSEDAVVKIESRDVKALDVRVYRITDPDGFFQRQENPYQVRATGKRGPNLGQLTTAFFGAVRDDGARSGGFESSR